MPFAYSELSRSDKYGRSTTWMPLSLITLYAGIEKSYKDLFMTIGYWHTDPVGGGVTENTKWLIQPAVRFLVLFFVVKNFDLAMATTTSNEIPEYYQRLVQSIYILYPDILTVVEQFDGLALLWGAYLFPYAVSSLRANITSVVTFYLPVKNDDDPASASAPASSPSKRKKRRVSADGVVSKPDKGSASSKDDAIAVDDDDDEDWYRVDSDKYKMADESIEEYARVLELIFNSVANDPHASMEMNRGSYARLVESLVSVNGFTPLAFDISNGSGIRHVACIKKSRFDPFRFFSQVNGTNIKDSQLEFLALILQFHNATGFTIVIPTATASRRDCSTTFFSIKFPQFCFAELDSASWSSSNLDIFKSPIATHWPPGEVYGPDWTDFELAPFFPANFQFVRTTDDDTEIVVFITDKGFLVRIPRERAVQDGYDMSGDPEAVEQIDAAQNEQRISVNNMLIFLDEAWTMIMDAKIGRR